MNRDHRVDDVRGQVVGGYWRSGRVYYEDRPQGPMITAETEEGVREIAQARVAEYKAMTAGDLIFPNPKAWTVRIYDG